MTSQEIALREAVDGTVAQLRDPALEKQVALAVPEGVSPQKLLRAAATAVLDNPQLAAPNLRATLLRATIKSAQDGLLPDGREAAFVIFAGKNPSIAYMPMVGGLRKIAAEHGIAIQTAVVHENDTFDPDFENGTANFKRARLGTDRGPIIGAYAQAQHRDGRRWLEVMDVAEIDRVRQVSRAKDSGPWKDWWDRMAEKTVARKLFKSLPLDPKDAERVQRILAVQDMNGEQAIDTLYGDRPPETLPRATETREPAPQAPEPQADEAGGRSPASPPPHTDDDIPFEGEEPPEDEPLEGEILDEDAPRFTAGRHEGMTIAEVYELGEPGIKYLKWARKNWATDPLATALAEFAEQHEDLQ